VEQSNEGFTWDPVAVALRTVEVQFLGQFCSDMGITVRVFEDNCNE
jgi:hypothetical protein